MEKEHVGWSIQAPTVVAALRRARWHRLPPDLGQHSWAVEPWLLQWPGPGVHSALAVGRGKGTPHPVWGLLTLQHPLHNNQLELRSGAWMILIFWARSSTHFFYYHQRGRVCSSSHRLLLHLKLNKGFWSFYRGRDSWTQEKGEETTDPNPVFRDTSHWWGNQTLQM